MGKHEVGTPKYIANKIKSKGLQKLRWYCQMCQKQCRDENGFKCHTMSESHHRQLLLFADNAHKYMDQFSRDFADGYLSILKRQFGTKRVPANRVYQEYITDRNHIHMNATIWLTLTAFVKWLGKGGKCIVDETEKGWFVTYIDRDPETLAAQEKKEKKEKMDKDDQERMMHFIKKQVKKGKSNNEPAEEFKQPLERTDGAPLVLDIKLKPKKILPIQPILPVKKAPETSKIKIKEEPLSEDEETVSNSTESKINLKRKESEDDPESCKKAKKEYNSKEEYDKRKGWLRIGLSVKIVTKSLGEKYYKAKGTVVELVDKDHFVGKVKLKSPENVENHIIKIDQEHLETVIPSIGRDIMILWGKYDGEIGVIEKVRIDDFCVDVELKDKKKLLKRIPYEQISKYVG
ncbi:DNA/RNA-binding protein KIN17 [Phymastichus coffea]|uniref:DNA/RNA-binding protein KIN17 n=1 Tax=Phymastichus coffea TaxID=108790 RepID=UPI00273CD6A8|nr:DNA/RNA-binding protein KIN17 [Phymastichus coffea]XP_058803861.1 DNA/RNA-binding protein KIN17 [Phymastichus coffea]